MTTETHDILTLMALGRPFQLGMLYNERNDQLIPGITLWDPKILKENIESDDSRRETSYKISTGDTFEEKSAMLGINAELKLSVLAGLVEVSGSAKYIDDRKKTEHIERMTLKYSMTTRFDHLTMAHLGKDNVKHQELFDQQIATHVVTGILYGAEAFFIFDREFSNNEDRTKVHGSLKAALNKIPKVQGSSTEQFDLNDEEKKVIENLNCQFYGDFNLKVNPSTYEEAVKLYRKLHSLLGPDNKKAVAKQVWLYPLHLLDNSVAKISRQISVKLVNRSIELIENLHGLEIKANDLKESLSDNTMLQRIKQQWSTFGSRISDFENSIKKKMMKILPEIRSSRIEENKLAELLGQVNKSPFNIQELENWLEAKTEELQILTNFTNILAEKVNIEPSQSLTTVLSDLHHNFLFCLVIHVIDRNDPFLIKLCEYLDNETCNQRYEGTSIDRWFNQYDIFQSIRQNTMLFINFAEANKDNKKYKFAVTVQYSDDFEKKGASIIFYRNSIRTNFEIPSEPEEIHATAATDNSVKLKWSKPQFGSESIQKYAIYGQKNSNSQWDLLLTTMNATESAIIPNLNGKYQFKISGITLYGVTPESDTSNTIGR